MMNPNSPETIFVGDSEMAVLMRARFACAEGNADWSQTSLGAVETWPQSLRSTLSICLNSRFPIAIYWGADHLLLYNDAWRPIVGNKHPWALGRPGREVWSEIWGDIGSELAGVLATGKGTVHKDDLLSMHRFGYTEECFFEYTFNPIQGKGGVVEGVFNVVTETTYRVLNERRARLLRELAAKTGIAKTAEESCVLMIEAFKSDPLDIPFALLYLINQDGKYAHLCGSTESAPDSFISPASIDLTEDDPDDWLIVPTVQTAQSQAIADLPTRFGTLPGSPWPEPPQEALVLPISATGQGKVTGVLVAVVSPRRRLDESYCDFLNQVSGQMALAIANARAYEEERKRAESLAELDRAKTTFFSNISHEFRTPLTLMLNPLEDTLAKPDSLAPGDREQLEIAYRNSQRLLKLVNTLLDFSRIEAGRIQAVYEPTDLATLTVDLAGVFRSAIERAGMRLQVDCPPLPEPVYVDREMWEKIVLNLLSNALKFTLEGEIAVSLRALNDQVELEVRDTGTGIPAEELPHIFERFHRVKGARGRSYEGSGIGLALVQELVKLHSGTIRVNSMVDQGTCFTVAMPMGCAHLPSERIGATRTLASTATVAMPHVEEMLRWSPTSIESSIPVQPKSSPTPTARILLADDNADMRDYLKRLLSQQYEVETVADGIAVLTAIQQQMPDLVLTDVMMPGIDGFELLRSLRSDPMTQDIPIILLSARAGEEARIKGLEAGADDYLTKPFSARELLARVEATLKLAQLRREATQREQALRLEAETAKQEAEAACERINQILDCMTDAFVAFDRQWCYTYVNPAALQLLQKSPEELIGKNVWEVFPSEVGGSAYRKLHQAMEEQVSVFWEEFGEPVQRWLEVRAYPSTVGIALYFQDITNRKQAEEALRESEQRLHMLANSVPSIVWMADSDGTILWASDDWYTYTGITPQQNARDWSQVIHPNDLDRCITQWHNVLATGTTYQIEVRNRRYDGEYRWFLTRALPMRDDAGRITAWFGSTTDIHDKKLAEEALRQSEERLRFSQELSLDAFTILDSVRDETGAIADFVWMYVNPKAAEILKHPMEELVGQRLLEVLPGNRLNSELFQRYVQVVETGEPHDIELFYNADGITGWFRNMAVKLEDGITIFFSDITQRKQTEQMLIEQKQLLELIATGRSLDECLSAICASVSRLKLHTRACILLTDAKRLTFSRSITPDFPSSFGQGLKDAPINELAIGTCGTAVYCGEPVTCTDIANDDRWSQEWRDLCVTYGILACHSSPIFGLDGLPLGSLMLCFNEARMPTEWEHQLANFGTQVASLVFERDRASLALRESEARFRNMADNAPFMVRVTDPTGYCTYLSQSWYNFSGQTPETGLGFGWLNVVYPDDQESARATFLAANDRCESFRLEYRLRHKDGKYIWAIDAATPWFGEEGQFKGYICSVIDISDRVQIERDRELILQQEQAAREAAEAANRIKDEFLAVVSHELRSPLNPILGWSKLLRSRQLDAQKADRALEVIERNAQMQAQLINDLLDVSRILRGKLSLDAQPVDLVGTIQAAIETVRLAAETKSIQIHTQFEPEVGYILGDADRLQQVVWNLLSNAVKFTSAGGRVDIRLEQVTAVDEKTDETDKANNSSMSSATKSVAQITVTDTGKGIPPDFLPYVFDHFRQENSTTTRRFGGLGLGLAIVRYLVELHGGTVQADSLGEGQGATFTVQLPLMLHQLAINQETQLSEPALDLQGTQILVVDDDDNTREFLAFLLELHGANVIATATAGEALTRLTQFKPDVLLSDIGMPDVNGYMLMQQVRALPPEQGGTIPAIALTAYAGEINQQQALSVGFQQHVPKPIEPEALVRVIASLLGQPAPT